MCQNLNETTFCVFRNQTLIGRTTIDEPKPKRDAISKMKFATVVGNDDESQWVPRNSLPISRDFFGSSLFLFLLSLVLPCFFSFCPWFFLVSFPFSRGADPIRTRGGSAPHAEQLGSARGALSAGGAGSIPTPFFNVIFVGLLIASLLYRVADS